MNIGRRMRACELVEYIGLLEICGFLTGGEMGMFSGGDVGRLKGGCDHSGRRLSGQDSEPSHGSYSSGNCIVMLHLGNVSLL